jgi:hypothetical protein
MMATPNPTAGQIFTVTRAQLVKTFNLQPGWWHSGTVHMEANNDTGDLAYTMSNKVLNAWAMRLRIFRNDTRAGICVRILTLLFLAGTLADPPGGRAQESTDIISLNLQDLKDKDANVRARAAMILGNIAAPGSPDNVREQTRKAIPALLEALPSGST